jgi:hypothetical protein
MSSTTASAATSTDLFPNNRNAALLSSIPGAESPSLREMQGSERIGEPFVYEIKVLS